MAFGIYVHIPYCLQRCVYCDFATYESKQILPPQEYINHVVSEIKFKSEFITPRSLDTVYFGGGTPSLLEPSLIGQILDALSNTGFVLKKEAEVTIEVNPATLNESKLNAYLRLGINRFSLGVQTFREDLLKLAHRKHSAQDTLDTLKLFNALSVNFSADILFALPLQTKDDLRKDLDTVLGFKPQHVSPYCLTVEESNPMSKNRPLDHIQIEMFSLIEDVLTQHQFSKYEISNFAQPGFESKHNMLYWNDEEYWGLGLSSHSYIKQKGPFGMRFWNSRNIQDYIKPHQFNWEVASLHEVLKKHEALTDYFHTSLRKKSGLIRQDFYNKFGFSLDSVAGKAIHDLASKNLITNTSSQIALTHQGMLVSNQVFKEFTFLEDNFNMG